MDVSHVTSDVMGHYNFAWTPEREGTYTIRATFQGSESYWGSAAETSIAVSPLSETPVEPQAQLSS